MNTEQKEISSRVIFNEFFKDGLFHIHVILDGKVLGQMTRGKPKSLKDYMQNQLIKDREWLLQVIFDSESSLGESKKITLKDRLLTAHGMVHEIAFLLEQEKFFAVKEELKKLDVLLHDVD